MDEKTKLLISIAAATASNCIPCFEHIYYKSKEMDVSWDEIQQAVDIGEKIKNGSSLAIKSVIMDIQNGDHDLTGAEQCPCSCN